MTFEGSCLCGSVQYEGSQQVGGGHCFCRDCRKSSGTGHCSHMIVPEQAFRVTGEVRFFAAPADSGNNGERGFCPTCGSPIYSTNSGMPGMVFVRASSLDTPEVFQPSMSVYTSRAPAWDAHDKALTCFPEMANASAVPKSAH